MKILTKKLETGTEWICYLQDESGNNILATLGKSLSDATAKMLNDVCFESIGPATLKGKFLSQNFTKSYKFIILSYMKLNYVNNVKDRVFKVIRSCDNYQQLIGAQQYMLLFFRLYKIGTNTELAKRMSKYYNLKRLQLRSKLEH